MKNKLLLLIAALFTNNTASAQTFDMDKHAKDTIPGQFFVVSITSRYYFEPSSFQYRDSTFTDSLKAVKYYQRSKRIAFYNEQVALWDYYVRHNEFSTDKAIKRILPKP